MINIIDIRLCNNKCECIPSHRFSLIFKKSKIIFQYHYGPPGRCRLLKIVNRAETWPMCVCVVTGCICGGGACANWNEGHMRWREFERFSHKLNPTSKSLHIPIHNIIIPIIRFNCSPPAPNPTTPHLTTPPQPPSSTIQQSVLPIAISGTVNIEFIRSKFYVVIVIAGLTSPTITPHHQH